MTLLNRVQLLYGSLYGRLNTKSLNFAGRLEASLVYYKRTRGAAPLEASAWALDADRPALPLTIIDSQLGEVSRWSDRAEKQRGDAWLEIARHSGATELTFTILTGKGLPNEVKARYLINGELYHTTPGQVRDSDGVTWQLYLDKENP